MEKLSTFQIVLMAVFGFSAVLGLILFANFGDFGGAKQNIGAVTIWGSVPKTAIEEQLEALSVGNDAYAGVVYVEVSPDSFANALSNAIAAGSGPDLVLISQEQLISEGPKLQLISFATIPQRTYLDSYLSLFELFLTPEGTYGVPYLLDPLVMYYNRQALASAGVALPPSSWEAIAGLAPTMTLRDSVGTISRSAVALGEYTNIQNARAVMSLLFLQSGTPITEVTTQGTRSALVGEKSFGQSPAESALNFYTQFANPAKTVYSWNRSLSNSREAFLAGDLAFYLGYASELPYLQEANPNLDFDMAGVPQPATGSSQSTYALGYAFALPKQTSNPTGAFTVATALTEPSAMKAVAEKLSMAPARKNTLTTSSGDTFTPIIYQSALLSRAWLSPAPSVTDGIFAGMISNVTSGRLDVTQALISAEQSINASLR
jgi:multiple sugar transport system substrate-binding protein